MELASYHRHPKFIVGTVASPYDIALVRFRTSFAGTSLKFMPLNGNKAYPMKHAFVRNIGYGRAHHSLPSAASFSLRQVDVPHVRAARANNFYARLSPATRIVKRFQMATGYLRDGNCGIW